MSSSVEFEQRTIDSTEDLLTAIYIQQSRTYDVLMSLLAAEHPDIALELMNNHAAGVIVTPAPALRGEDATD
jgi:hypothetical protein